MKKVEIVTAILGIVLAIIPLFIDRLSDVIKAIIVLSILLFFTLILYILQIIETHQKNKELKKTIKNRDSLIDNMEKLQYLEKANNEIHSCLDYLFVSALLNCTEDKLKKIYEAYCMLLKKLH